MTTPDAYDDAGRSSGLSADFRAAVTAELLERDYTVVEWETEGVHVRGPDDEGEQYLGLSNLYRRAQGVARADWPQLIGDFLDHLASISEGPKLPQSLDTLTAQLRPRLGPPFTRELKAQPWSIPLPGTPLVISLVIDFPHAMAYATEEMVQNSQASAEELLECALDNLRQDTPEDFLQPLSENLELLLGHTGDGYDASRALIVEELLPQDAPAGLWLALPSRDELYVWPVSPQGLQHLPYLKLFAQDNYHKHPYPISDEIFWLYEGRWHTFTIRFQAPDTVSISPPPEFIELLEDWAGSDDLENNP
ncbi:MAG: hypothetical protein WHU94_11315 [Thermogemmata sp.]|uniref:Uncharacterized protein n=1 Tax=Thermogemmata fonticola TaxID=2755323 RepID=A0A7V8VF50_9BACT|nr:hypothetical protein [Thermogemmata fonticola]MBA2226890.1 hypothetical protein [Thermogemmata fonticola]